MPGFAFIPGVFGCLNHQVLDPVHNDAELLSEHKLKFNPVRVEAFPNAEHLFQQAFAVQDPAPPLLHILNTHPTYPALHDFVSYYVEAVYNDSYCVKTLAFALARTSHSPDAPFLRTRHTLLKFYLAS